MNRISVHIYFVVAVALLIVHSSRAFAQQIRTVEVSQMCTVHLVFSSDVKYVDIPAREYVSAKIIPESQNMVALNVLKPFDFATTISVLESDGIMQTFRLKYAENPETMIVDTRVGAGYATDNRVNTLGVLNDQPAGNTAEVAVKSVGSDLPRNVSAEFLDNGAPALEQVMKLDQRLYHIGDQNSGIEVYCSNLFEYSDNTYVILTLVNATDGGYETGSAQFAIEWAKKSSENLAKDNTVWPIKTSGVLSCPPGNITKMGYLLPKVNLERGQKLKVYIYERGGSRNLVLSLSEKDVNRAVSPVM